MNSKCFPGTDPLVVKRGDKVRMRFGNLSGIDNHPVHLHGYSFRIAGTDGGEIPRAAQEPHTTVLVPTGSCRVIEFVADNPGDWAMHCHMTHHVMNQMGHGIPNVLGVRGNPADRRVRRLIPGYMPMGRGGMAGMGDMTCPFRRTASRCAAVRVHTERSTWAACSPSSKCETNCGPTTKTPAGTKRLPALRRGWPPPAN
jgi:hypothetical protein